MLNDFSDRFGKWNLLFTVYECGTHVSNAALRVLNNDISEPAPI